MTCTLALAAAITAALAGPDPQPWARHLGGPEAERINACESLGSSIFLAGMTASTNPLLDAWVVKMTPGGGVIWGVSIGGPQIDEARDVVPTPDGGCLVVGYTSSFGAGSTDGWIVRLDAGGGVLWQRTYGTADCELFTAAAPSPNGFYVGGGYGCTSDAWLLEIDHDGDVLWQHTYGGDEVDEITAITATDDGVTFVAWSNSDFDVESVPFHRPWLVSLDADGEPLMSRTYNVSGGDIWFDIEKTDDGYLVAGEVLAAAFFRGDLWTVKLNDGGGVMWDQRVGDNFGVLWYDAAADVIPAADGGAYAVGSTGTAGAGSDDLWVVKFDADGVFEWERTYGTTGFDGGLGATQLDDGRIVLAGFSQVLPAPGPIDGFVMATTPEGLLNKTCDLIGQGDPNIWTDPVIVHDVITPPTPTRIIPADTRAAAKSFTPYNTLCAPTLHQRTK